MWQMTHTSRLPSPLGVAQPKLVLLASPLGVRVAVLEAMVLSGNRRVSAPLLSHCHRVPTTVCYAPCRCVPSRIDFSMSCAMIGLH